MRGADSKSINQKNDDDDVICIAAIYAVYDMGDAVPNAMMLNKKYYLIEYFVFIC